MRAWWARYLLFLVWLQWVDRRATSSFLVGVSLQIVVLGMGLWQLREEPREVLLAGAVRAVLLVGTAVCALSAMSAFQNEFRFETIWQTFRDSAAFSRLMLARALAMTAITAVPMALPFVVAVLIRPQDAWLALGMYAMSLLVMTAYTHVLTLGLAVVYRPSQLVPWIRQGVMVVALGTVTFLSPPWLRQLFPFVWLERMAAPGMSGLAAGVTAGLTVVWWLLALLLLAPAARAVVHRRLLDNVESR